MRVPLDDRATRRWPAAIACLMLAAAGSAPCRADWDDRPGFDFHPQSSADAPCGVGTPPRGHFPGEVRPSSRPDGLTLTVRQDAHRLCYVAGNVAEAPVIRVRQGDKLIITLKNEITDPKAIDSYVAVGHLDTPNQPVQGEPGVLPVVPGTHHAATGATNLHVHGFAVPPVAPQDEVLMNCVDPAVGPANCGQRAFTYRYQVPAAMPAGLYWYHPHVHGEVQAQMLMGLSGAIVVEGPEDDARRAAGIQDRILIIRQAQDLDAGKTAQGAAPAPSSPVLAAPRRLARTAPESTGAPGIDTAHELACNANAGADQITLNGAKVLNGTVQDADLAHYEIAAGTTQLWRVLNAATDAFLDLALVDETGKPLPLTMVARDGAPITDDAGKRLSPVPSAHSQRIPPAGRLEFLISAPPQGVKTYLITHAVDTGCAGDTVPERRLALVTASPVAGSPAAPPPVPIAKSLPDAFSGLLARKTDRVRTIAMAEYPRPGAEDQTDFYIAERKQGAVLRPYTMGDAPAISVDAGTVEEWEVENWTRELHAFHIHQLHFRVLAVNGRPLAEPPLLDTVEVPYADFPAGGGPVTPGRVRIKLAFAPELAGDIPFHCHLVDHEDNGMMGVLRVLPRQAARSLPGTRLSTAEMLANPQICGAVRPVSLIQ